MNIAILTFQFADNYGAMLQAYALKSYLTELGHRVEFIDYTPEKQRVFYSPNPFLEKGLKSKIKKLLQFRSLCGIHKRFDEFRTDYLNVPSGIPYDPARLSSQFDCVIVGSDQVWNERIVGDLSPYLFEGVSDPCLKASYAASMSIIDKDAAERSGMKDALSHFKYVSVREDSVRVFLEELGIHATTVVDPVFLLTSDKWSSFAVKPETIGSEPYAFMYLLREDGECVAEAERYAKEHGLKLYYAHPLNRKLNSRQAVLVKDADPREFVWLIEHASIVFTNSFHATAFSAIFSKTIHYSHQQSLGDRVKDLLSIIEAEGEIVTLSVSGKEKFLKRYADSVNFLEDVLSRAKEQET